MNNTTYKKLWVVTLTVLALLFTSASLSAAWPILVNPPKDESRDKLLQFGEGGIVTTVLNINEILSRENKVLVPVGKANGKPNLTEEVICDLTLFWDEALDSEGSAGQTDFIGELTYSYEVDGVDSSVHGLINVTPINNDDTINFREEKTISFKVTLTLPANQTEYELIKGREITIRVKISIINPQTIT